MATYPTDPSPNYPLIVIPVFKTIISKLDGGKEQRRSKFTFPKYNVTVNYNGGLGTADASTILDFFLNRRGAYEAFYIIDYTALTHVNLYVGTGDGATDTFDLPATNTSSRTVYLDNDEETPSQYFSGGGEGGADRVEFSSAPGNGVIITADLTGYLRCHVRFAQDMLNRELFSYQLQRFGTVELIGVGPV